MPRRSFYVLPILALLVLFSSACRKGSVIENAAVPRLMVETRGVNYGNLTGKLATLPVSGTSITVQKEPVVNEFEILNVELVKVEMGLALMVQTTEKGARDLYRGTVSNMGSRLVLMVNDNAIGAHRIDSAIQDGTFYTFVELPDEELGQLVLDIKATIQDLQTKLR